MASHFIGVKKGGVSTGFTDEDENNCASRIWNRTHRSPFAPCGLRVTPYAPTASAQGELISVAPQFVFPRLSTPLGQAYLKGNVSRCCSLLGEQGRGTRCEVRGARGPPHGGASVLSPFTIYRSPWSRRKRKSLVARLTHNPAFKAETGQAVLSRRPPFAYLPDQGFRGYSQFAVQASDHLQGQRPLAVQDFINPVDPADHRHQVFGDQTLLLHAEADGFDRVGQRHRKMFPLIRLDQRHQHIQALAIGRSLPCRHKAFDFLQCGAVVSFRLNGLYFHTLVLKSFVRRSCRTANE